MEAPLASLVVTVSVESDMPRGQVPARTTLRNLAGVHRLQRLCERFGVKPTWLLTWPVIAGPEGERFARLAAEDRAELGVCLQPWTTPPFEAQEDRLSRAGVAALPAPSVAAKLGRLTEAFDQHLGQRPRAHRAVLAGLDGGTLQTLERLGYAIDTTAVPRIDARAEGGSDWREAPDVPWFPDRQRPVARGASPVLEVPVTTGFSKKIPDFADRWATRTAPALRRVLEQQGLLTLLRLDPVAHEAAVLRPFARRLVEDGLPCLHLALRSPELVAGESRRCPEASDVERLFSTLEDLLRHLVDELRVQPRTLTGFAGWYLNEVALR